MTKERWIVVVSIMMCILGCVCFWLGQKNIHKEQQTKTEEKSIYKTLSESDKKAADIYAELYEESVENVSRIYQKTNDWEKTNKQLEKQFFTIDENIKYEMQKEGYRLEDLEKAEKYWLPIWQKETGKWLWWNVPIRCMEVAVSISDVYRPKL